MQATIVSTFSWYYVLIAAFFVVFALVLGFSRWGDIKLGKDDDEPEFSLGAWFSLLFAAGMGIGLVFYGVSEPLSHFVTPRPGVTGTEAQLAQSALVQTYLHWGVHAWAIYVVIGVALAYAIHRRGRPVSIRWALEPLLGKRVRGTWGNVIDTLALVGTVFGVATSLGLGVMQISSGLSSAGFGEPDTLMQIIIIAIITAFVLFSVLSGVARGMKWLSRFNLLLAAALLVFVLFAGQTTYILREWVQSIGAYLQNFIGLSFTVSAFQGEAGEQWQAAWTSFYWGRWISWAPFVGVFIARVSKGRTVRQFVTGVLIVPTLVGILWFAVLGGSALKQEMQHSLPPAHRAALTEPGRTVCRTDSTRPRRDPRNSAARGAGLGHRSCKTVRGWAATASAAAGRTPRPATGRQRVRSCFGRRTSSSRTSPTTRISAIPKMPKCVAPNHPMNSDHSRGERKLITRPVVA